MQKSLNELAQDQLNEITTLAALFFTPREIAQMLELPAEAFISECCIEGGVLYKAFYSGRLQGEVDLRTGIMKMAKAGSTPAQAMAMDMLKLSKVKLLDR